MVHTKNRSDLLFSLHSSKVKLYQCNILWEETQSEFSSPLPGILLLEIQELSLCLGLNFSVDFTYALFCSYSPLLLSICSFKQLQGKLRTFLIILSLLLCSCYLWFLSKNMSIVELMIKDWCFNRVVRDVMHDSKWTMCGDYEVSWFWTCMVNILCAPRNNFWFCLKK